MKLSALVFLALLGLASAASLQDIDGSSLHNVNGSSLQDGSAQHRGALQPPESYCPPVSSDIPVPGPLTPAELEYQQDPEMQPSSSMFGFNANLEWLTWNGSLPNGSVASYNAYTKRNDYVCKYQCEAGFYNPSLGPYCHYPYHGKEYSAPEFEILVNKDNFEFLEWKEGSLGSMPPHSVRTCPEGAVEDIYVGKNKCGLGKVVPWVPAFFLPWQGKEYVYGDYQVLAINREVYSQHISDVKYFTDEAELFQFEPEVVSMSEGINVGCVNVVKTVTLSKTETVQMSWKIVVSIMQGIKGSITAGFPKFASGTLEYTLQMTVQFEEGTTISKTLSHSVSMQLTVPPQHYCAVRMDIRRIKALIPFTARLTRTYSNGETQSTSIAGTYEGVQVSWFRSVFGGCEPLADAKPCP